MDVCVNFPGATKWQAESMFEHFFSPSRPSAPSPNETPTLAAPRENLTRARRASGTSADAVPVLEEEEIVQLRQRFADAIPEGEMSVWPIFPQPPRGLFSMHWDLQVASLQGYLLKNMRRPRECVDEVTEWCGVSIVRSL